MIEFLYHQSVPVDTIKSETETIMSCRPYVLTTTFIPSNSPRCIRDFHGLILSWRCDMTILSGASVMLYWSPWTKLMVEWGVGMFRGQNQSIRSSHDQGICSGVRSVTWLVVGQSEFSLGFSFPEGDSFWGDRSDNALKHRNTKRTAANTQMSITGVG